MRACLLFVCLLVFNGLPALAADVAGPAVVIDGDTFDVAGTRVRLFGIDAPEQDQTCISPDGAEWPCGLWVTEQIAGMVHGRQVECRRRDTDRYGRMVATCTLDGADLGQEIVNAGLAFAYRRYSMIYDLDEKGAAVRGVGLHAHQVQSPNDYRRAGAQQTRTAADTCAIKGNISRSGVKIYHLPGQKDYAKTRIRTELGERWFCSEAEARSAGWRAARR